MNSNGKHVLSITCFFDRIRNMKLLFRVVQKTLLCILIFFFLSCSDKNEIDDEGFVGEKTSIDVPSLALPSFDSSSNTKGKFVVVLLGYGYNEGIIKENLLAALDQEYGFAESGGIIIPLIYPDDFISLGYERISLLPERIEEQLNEYIDGTSDSPLTALMALITLGAPDGTHGALADLQDATIDTAVFSIFSQDDVLGTESGSDLVIDYRPVQIEGVSAFDTTEETNLSYPDDAFEVIAPLINTALNWKQIENDGLLIPALRTEFLKRTACNLFVYVDPQTGLRSQNHYVLENTGREAQ